MSGGSNDPLFSCQMNRHHPAVRITNSVTGHPAVAPAPNRSDRGAAFGRLRHGERHRDDCGEHSLDLCPTPAVKTSYGKAFRTRVRPRRTSSVHSLWPAARSMLHSGSSSRCARARTRRWLRSMALDEEGACLHRRICGAGSIRSQRMNRSGAGRRSCTTAAAARQVRARSSGSRRSSSS